MQCVDEYALFRVECVTGSAFQNVVQRFQESKGKSSGRIPRGIHVAILVHQAIQRAESPELLEPFLLARYPRLGERPRIHPAKFEHPSLDELRLLVGPSYWRALLAMEDDLLHRLAKILEKGGTR